MCSGIEAATAAWHPLGWQPAFFAEIEPFCCALLKHRYPEVSNYGDFTKITDSPAIDLLVGGTPCQSFSVAGKRAGLDDPRGNLTLEFLTLAGRLRPRWLVWENVPGVLSDDGGRTFGTVLGILGQLGYGFAWRVLDAQFFGVPQRRRRVFVVGYLGDWRPPAAVLFERSSLSGNPAAGGKTWEDVAGSLGGGSGSRGWCDDTDRATFIPQLSNACCARDCKRTLPEASLGTVVTHCLRADGFDASEDGTGRGTPLAFYPTEGRDFLTYSDLSPALKVGHGNEPAIAACLSANYGKQPDNSDTSRGPTIVIQSVNMVREKKQNGIGISDGAMYSLTERDQHAVALHENQRAEMSLNDTAGSLTVGGGKPGQGYPAIAFQEAQTGVREYESAGSLRSDAPGTQPSGTLIRQQMAVRRLTPTECERLQGFPDGWTAIPYRGKPAADGPRYRALGNSMAIAVVRWIGERIALVETITTNRRLDKNGSSNAN